MIYVMMALYQEAHGLIRELELKKNTACGNFIKKTNQGMRRLRCLAMRAQASGWL